MSQDQINRTPRGNGNDSGGNSNEYRPYVVDHTPELEKAKKAVKTAKEDQKKKKSGGCGCW